MRKSYRYPSPHRSEARNPHNSYYESAYMKRMNERPASLPSASKSQMQTSHYESSYLKKLNDNPAPSIARSFSHSSHSRDTSKSNKAVRSAQDPRNKLPRIHTQNTQAISPRSSRPAQSPAAATIDAILGQLSNGGAGRSHDSDDNDRKSFSNSPTHLERNPSREPRPRPDAMFSSRTTHGHDDLRPVRRNSFHYSGSISENRSPSPTSRRSFSISPIRGRKTDPLSDSQRLNYRVPSVASIKYNDRRSPSREPVKKLPHERHMSPPPGTRRIPTGRRHSSQFWTQVSVKVSSALLKSGADKKYAEAAQLAVIQAGDDQYDTSQEALNLVASKASLAVLTAGGDHNQAAIATVACLKADEEEVNQSVEFKKQIHRQMSTVVEKTADFVQSSYDGSAKAVNKISEIASLQLENLRLMGEKSVQQYQQYQKTLLLERKMQMKRIKSERMNRGHYDRNRGRDRTRGRSHRDSRDESYEDDRNHRRTHTRRGAGRYESDNDSLDIHRRRRNAKKKSDSGTFDDSRSSTLYSTSTESYGTGSSARSSSSSDISRRHRGSRREPKSKKASKSSRSSPKRRRSRSRSRLQSDSLSSRATFET